MQDPEEETIPELEEAMAKTRGEVSSIPPADMVVGACVAHGSPFERVGIREDGSKLKIFEDGCKELL